jgi:hypothetical protein
MKLILILISIILFGFSNLNESPNDFDYKLSNIARKFRSEIMDRDECESLKREADKLAAEIEDAIKNTGKYSYEETIKFKTLIKEAEALRDFIASVGNCGNYIQSIENFKLANRRVGASVATVIESKYCIDIISVSIGNYVAYLGENNSTKNYTVTYKWKAENDMNRGNGTMGLTKLSVRHIYNNREKPNQKNIAVFGITCIEF